MTSWMVSSTEAADYLSTRVNTLLRLGIVSFLQFVADRTIFLYSFLFLFFSFFIPLSVSTHISFFLSFYVSFLVFLFSLFVVLSFLYFPAVFICLFISFLFSRFLHLPLYLSYFPALCFLSFSLFFSFF